MLQIATVSIDDIKMHLAGVIFIEASTELQRRTICLAQKD